MATLPNPSFSTADGKRQASKPIFRYYWAAIFLFTTYVLFLVVPWTFTCILMVRPMTKPSYHNQVGEYLPEDIREMERWRTAIDVLNRIAATIAVPTVSALLAQAAVVFTQRRKTGQDLGLGQMITLADRSWTDLAAYIEILYPTHGRHGEINTKFLWLGSLLIILTASLGPLQTILTENETLRVVTCKDVLDVQSYIGSKVAGYYSCKTQNSFSEIARISYDPMPRGLAMCPSSLVVQQTMDKIIGMSDRDTQIHLWLDNHTEASITDGPAMGTFDTILERRIPYFASSLTNGTTTGVLKQHAVRMDSEVQCRLASQSDFPVPCPGDKPFETEFSLYGLSARVCGEGKYTQTPWTRSRNKQEILERLWFDQRGVNSTNNFTMRCEATSRRGWFELGNHYNNFTHGPLLDTWPTDQEIRRDFNDIAGSRYFDSSEDSADINTDISIWDIADVPFIQYNNTTPGPLITTTLALFGSRSMFNTASTANEGDEAKQAFFHICQTYRVPFARLLQSRAAYCSDHDFEGGLVREVNLMWTIRNFFSTFSKEGEAQDLLARGAFFANEALLTTVANAGAGSEGVSRIIYSSQGSTIVKPRWALHSIIVVTLLIGIEILLLSLLLRYIYSVPTWTRFLDGHALLRIGMQLGEDSKSMDIAEASGLIGLTDSLEVGYVEDVPLRALGAHGFEDIVESASAPLQEKNKVPLALGGPGLITKSLATWRD